MITKGSAIASEMSRSASIFVLFAQNSNGSYLTSYERPHRTTFEPAARLSYLDISRFGHTVTSCGKLTSVHRARLSGTIPPNKLPSSNRASGSISRCGGGS